MLDEEMQFAMDFDLWVRIALEGRKVQYVPKPLASFRQHSGSKTSTQHVTRIRDRYRIAEKVLSYPALPADIGARLGEMEAHVELNAAYIAYKAGDMPRARLHAGRHIGMAKHHSNPIGLAILARSLLSRSSSAR
jgi:hypothetical protein